MARFTWEIVNGNYDFLLFISSFYWETLVRKLRLTQNEKLQSCELILRNDPHVTSFWLYFLFLYLCVHINLFFIAIEVNN